MLFEAALTLKLPFALSLAVCEGFIYLRLREGFVALGALVYLLSELVVNQVI
jgi:hypothetical protein